MTELWIPQRDKHPDVNNVYDMMIVFQEQLDRTQDREEKIAQARVALLSLGSALKHLDDDNKQITLSTKVALLDSTEERGKGNIVEDVGLNGVLEDVHAISVGTRIPLSISLGIDVMTMFDPENPTELDYALTNAKAPISSVEFIETLAP